MVFIIFLSCLDLFESGTGTSKSGPTAMGFIYSIIKYEICGQSLEAAACQLLAPCSDWILLGVYPFAHPSEMFLVHEEQWHVHFSVSVCSWTVLNMNLPQELPPSQEVTVYSTHSRGCSSKSGCMSSCQGLTFHEKW